MDNITPSFAMVNFSLRNTFTQTTITLMTTTDVEIVSTNIKTGPGWLSCTCCQTPSCRGGLVRVAGVQNYCDKNKSIRVMTFHDLLASLEMVRVSDGCNNFMIYRKIAKCVSGHVTVSVCMCV